MAPEPICMSMADEDGSSIVVASCEPEFDELLVFCLEQELQVNTNIGFDMSVLLAHRPHLADKVWAAYNRDGVTDTIVREKLLVLADTGDLEWMTLQNGARQKLSYSQAAMEAKHLGVDRSADKEDEDAWRSNYSALKGMKAADYPQEAYEYSRLDAVYALAIAKKQEEINQEALRAQFLNTRASLALYLSSCWGFEVDFEEVEKLYAELSARYHEHALVERDGKTVMAYHHLLKEGLLRPGIPTRPHSRQLKKAVEEIGHEPADWAPHKERLAALGIKFTEDKPSSYDTKAKRALVERVSKLAEIPVVLTETGLTCCDGDVLQELAGLDSAIDELIDRNEIQKLVTTELPRMRAGRVHPRYDVLKKTSRTSSYGTSKKDKAPAYPAVNIQQIDPRVRHAYKASEGKVLCSVDYDYIELVSVAQKCLTLFGQSVLADKINAGFDPHAYLGARIMQRFEPSFRGSLDADANYALFMGLKETDYRWWKHFRTLAKPTGLGLPGGLGAARFVGYAKSTYGVDIVKLAGSMDAALAMARELKSEWLRTYPEMDAYFRWVKQQCMDLEWSSYGDERYCYVSPHGTIRRNCRYTEATNGAALQTPTAEGAKIALWELAKACYDSSVGSCLLGCHMVAFIHDEVIVEMPLDALMHERAFEVARIMKEGMSKVMTDVVVGAKPACMLRWDKRAEAVFGPDGRLQVWFPEAA